MNGFLSDFPANINISNTASYPVFFSSDLAIWERQLMNSVKCYQGISDMKKRIRSSDSRIIFTKSDSASHDRRSQKKSMQISSGKLEYEKFLKLTTKT